MIELRREDGIAFAGWTTASVTAGLEQMARSISADVAVTDAGSDALELLAGQPISVWADDVRVATGYIDEIAPSYSADADSVSLSGRSRTADLVDCSPPVKPVRGVTLAKLAEIYAEPYGIEVVDLVGDRTVLGRAAPHPGDKIGDYLQGRARERGIMVTDDELGRLVLYRASSPPVSGTIVGRGVDGVGCALSAQGTFSVADRFSQYEVRGTVLTDAEVLSSATGLARDYGLARPRRKVVVPERPLAAGGAKRVAEWEALTRAGRGQQATYTVSGWTQASGDLWTPGLLVELVDSRMRLDHVRWVVSDVTWSIDASAGRRTELTVRPLQAYLAYPEMPRTAGVGSSGFQIDVKDGKIVSTAGATAVQAKADAAGVLP